MAAMRLSNEPIIVLTFDDGMDERQMIDLYMQSVKLAEAIDGPVYRVVDLRDATQTAGRIVAALGELARQMSGAATIPDLAMVFVGRAVQSNSMFFDTLNAALGHARDQVAEPVR